MSEKTKGATSIIMYECRSNIWNDRPHLAQYVAHVSQIWALIEGELAIIFGISSGSRRIVVMSAFSKVLSINTRLGMITNIFEDRNHKNIRKEWKKLKKSVEEGARRRNEIVHSRWAIVESEPDIIYSMSPVPGKTSEFLDLKAYTHKDFCDQVNFLEGVRHELVQFRNTLTDLDTTR